MIYWSRDEVERIGRAGSCMWVDAPDGLAFRYLSSFWLYVEGRDQAFTPHGADGFWEAWITCWMSKQFDKHTIFVDVGANVGYYAMMAAKHGLATYAIEPNPAVAKMLRNSINLNRCPVSVDELALSDESGEAVLAVPDRHSGGASIVSDGEGEVVDTYRWDEVYDFHPRSSVLVKIDAEGAEPLIWRGMKGFRERQQQFTVLLEWETSRFEDAEGFAESLFRTGTTFYVDDYGDEIAFSHHSQIVNLNGLQMVGVRKV